MVYHLNVTLIFSLKVDVNDKLKQYVYQVTKKSKPCLISGLDSGSEYFILGAVSHLSVCLLILASPMLCTTGSKPGKLKPLAFFPASSLDHSTLQ